MSLAGPSAPYTRSRTNLFLSYRDSAIRPSTSYLSSPRYGDFEESASESRGLMEDTVLEMGNSRAGARPDALPPRWVDLADRVDEIVDKVKPKSESDLCYFV
jgi:syntaxin 16